MRNQTRLRLAGSLKSEHRREQDRALGDARQFTEGCVLVGEVVERVAAQRSARFRVASCSRASDPGLFPRPPARPVARAR